MFKGFKPRQDLTGYTAIPNEWFDEVLRNIDNLAELKIVQAVFRKTYGWIARWENEQAVYKLDDEISYTQFEKITGLSSASISEGIKRAIDHGYIIQVYVGDFKTGKSSRYRIRTVHDEITLESKAEKGSTLETKASTTLESKADSTLDSKVTKESNINKRKSSDEEVYSTEDFSKKETQYDKYKKKSIGEYNTNDLGYYFSEKYQEKIGIRYSSITNKDRSLLKKMLDSYGVEVCIKGIDYLMLNYSNLITGYPSIAVFYGFRNTIIPSAVKGDVPSKKDVRESRLTQEEIEREKENTDIVQW